MYHVESWRVGRVLYGKADTAKVADLALLRAMRRAKLMRMLRTAQPHHRPG
jgi:hypothetical protein